MLTRRPTEVNSSKLTLSQTRRKKFQELAEQKRSGSSYSKFEIPEQGYRNFTNIYGKRTERRASKHEKVTLQSIMSSNWSNVVPDTA